MTKISIHPLIQPSPLLWSMGIAPLGNCERVHTSVLNLIFRQSKCCWCMEFAIVKFRNLQSLLVCSIILWKSSLLRVEWISGWRSWLESRIQGCLVSDVHSLHAVMCLPLREKSKDCILLDKAMKKTPVDLQKRFPIYHEYHKYLAAYRCGSAFTQDSIASNQDHEKVGVTLVDR